MGKDKTKISNYVSKKTWDTVIWSISQMPGIKRDSLLNHWLYLILPDLRDMPANDLTKIEFLFWANEFVSDDKVTINITLDKALLAELDEILLEKNVPRGHFISAFLDSLEDSLIELEFRINNPFKETVTREQPLYMQIFPTEENVKLIRSFTTNRMTSEQLATNMPDDFL